FVERNRRGVRYCPLQLGAEASEVVDDGSETGVPGKRNDPVAGKCAGLRRRGVSASKQDQLHSSGSIRRDRHALHRCLENAWLAAVSDLLHFGGVLDRVALRVFVIGKQVVTEQMASRTPDALHAALAGVEDCAGPVLPVFHFERGMVEGGLTVAGLAESERV